MSPVVDTHDTGIPCHLFKANSERWTFSCDTVRLWVEERLDGRVLNACAGETRLRHSAEIVRNDANPDRPADYQMARAIGRLLRPGGRVLAFGYTVDMIPSSLSYDIVEVAVFTIPGPGKDFLGSVHERNQQELGRWSG